MELEFSSSGQVGSGHFPSLVHHSDNTVMLFWVDADGKLNQKNIKQESADYDWGAIQFSEPDIATADNPMRYARIKQIPRIGVFSVWVKDDMDDNDLPIETQRFAIFDPLSDLTEYVRNGRIQMSHDNLIYSLQLEVENYKDRVINEDRAMIIPGTQIELLFGYGDSDISYPMGVFYVDRVGYSVGKETINIDARSTAGKLLKDQQLNEVYKFPRQPVDSIVRSMIEHAGLNECYLDSSELGFSAGYEFDPNTDIKTALEQILEPSTSYKLFENLDGKCYIGNLTNLGINNLFTGYAFERDSLISRNITKDDQDVYSKLCVRSEVDAYYVKTQPFWADDHYLAYEKAEKLKNQLLSEKGWESSVEISNQSDEMFRVKIGYFGAVNVNAAQSYLTSIGIASTKHNEGSVYYLLSNGLENAYGYTGRERAQMLLEDIDEKRKESDLPKWHMDVISIQEKQKWYRVWIGYMGTEAFVQEVKDYLDLHPSVGWYAVGRDADKYYIVTGLFDSQQGAEAVRNDITTAKGWYCHVEEYERDTQRDGWRIKVLNLDEQATLAVETYMQTKGWWHWKQSDQSQSGYNIIITGLFGPKNGLTEEQVVNGHVQDLKANGWAAESERLSVEKIDYYLSVGPLAKHKADEVEAYLSNLQIDSESFKEKDESVKLMEFRRVHQNFDMAYGDERCYYLDLAKNTPCSAICTVADKLKEQLSNAGTVEAFESSFVPQMIAGDGATITRNGRREYIGAITDVMHQFGRSGYRTQFTVDSGERKGREKISDYFVKEKPKARRD